MIYEATSSQDHIAGGDFNQGTPSPFMETGPELNNIRAPPGVVYAKPDKNGKKNLEAEENNMYANLKGIRLTLSRTRCLFLMSKIVWL